MRQMVLALREFPGRGFYLLVPPELKQYTSHSRIYFRESDGELYLSHPTYFTTKDAAIGAADRFGYAVEPS